MLEALAPNAFLDLPKFLARSAGSESEVTDVPDSLRRWLRPRTRSIHRTRRRTDRRQTGGGTAGSPLAARRYAGGATSCLRVLVEARHAPTMITRPNGSEPVPHAASGHLLFAHTGINPVCRASHLPLPSPARWAAS